MSTTYINAAPGLQTLGVQDKSTRTLLLDPEVLPTHLPKVYIFAQKGVSDPQLVVGNTRNSTYGSDTFDLRKPYATHQTVLSNVLNSYGNAQMIERMIPPDAGPKSNFCLYIDLVETEVPVYERGVDGTYVTDMFTGLPVLAVPNTTQSGYKVKFVIESKKVNKYTTLDNELMAGTTIPDSVLFGNETEHPGDQTVNGVQSRRYPLLQWHANSVGSVFNNSGLRIWSPTTSSSAGVYSKIITTSKVYPFKMAAIKRADSNTTASIKETLGGESSFDFTLKPGLIDPSLDARFSLGDIYLSNYQNTNDKRFPSQWADLSGMHIYQANIDAVLKLLFAKEAVNFGTMGSDFEATATVADSLYLYNLFGFTSSNNVPYGSVILNVSDANSVRLTESTNLFASGGSDGTMTDAVFNQLVSDAVDKYADPSSHLMDTANYPESFIYDTGFPLTVKTHLCNFISIRKDTAVILSTYDHTLGRDLTAHEEYSMSIALNTKIGMFPESDYFGTVTYRGMVIGTSGTLIGSQWTDKVATTIELAGKAARMMGSGDGRWKPEYLFDRAPNNFVTFLKDISIGFRPYEQRANDWTVGLCYPQPYSRSTMYMPAWKTVYNDDTSVLNNFFNMAVCIECQKVGDRVFREYSGNVDLSDAQLLERVNKSITRQTLGRFAGLAKIKPNAFYTESDVARGYSWTMPIDVYMNNSKTASQLYIRAYRMSDYNGK